MENKKKIFLISGIIITAIVLSVICYSIIAIITSNKSKPENDIYTRQTTIYLEGKEDDITHAYAQNFARHKGDTLTFSFTSEPNGLMEVYLKRQDNSNFNLFTATNIANYELVLPDDSCSLTFVNLELFDIIISLKYSI